MSDQTNAVMSSGMTAQDGEACTVIMLQHLDYQGRLFSLLDVMQKTKPLRLNKSEDEYKTTEKLFGAKFCEDVEDDPAKTLIHKKNKKSGKKRKRKDCSLESKQKSKKKRHKGRG